MNYGQKADELTARADSRRRTLREAAIEDSVGVDDLARMVNDIADAEGQAHVYAIAAHVNGKDGWASQADADAAIREWVTSLLTAGADDTWSGRTNDAKRAHWDGIRTAAGDVLRGL